jgi:hypothetical protein
MLRARHRVLLTTLGLAACAAGALQLPATASSAASETTHTPATAQLSVRQLTALSPQAIGALQTKAWRPATRATAMSPFRCPSTW